MLIGGPGTGKSHVATAIDVQAIEHHRRKVRFYSTVELVNALEQEKALGKTGKMAEMMTKIDLVILDELGYLPFSQYDDYRQCLARTLILIFGGDKFDQIFTKSVASIDGECQTGLKSAQGAKHD